MKISRLPLRGGHRRHQHRRYPDRKGSSRPAVTQGQREISFEKPRAALGRPSGDRAAPPLARAPARRDPASR
ncbi:hypothetical protein TKK_0010812 [Trichogramma kaykai]